MFREIKKKMLLLENRKPFEREAAQYMQELCLVDWISSSMKLSGSNVVRDSVRKILKGEMVIEVSLTDHKFISDYSQTIRKIYDMREMGTELDRHVLDQLYQLLWDEEPELRSHNPVLHELGYNPPHFREVEEGLDKLFYWYKTDDTGRNPILKAAYVHNKIVELFPYEKESMEAARLAMLYSLISAGYNPVSLPFSEQEYNGCLAVYLRKKDVQPFYNQLEKAVYSQLDVMLQLTVITP